MCFYLLDWPKEYKAYGTEFARVEVTHLVSAWAEGPPCPGQCVTLGNCRCTELTVQQSHVWESDLQMVPADAGRCAQASSLRHCSPKRAI